VGAGAPSPSPQLLSLSAEPEPERAAQDMVSEERSRTGELQVSVPAWKPAAYRGPKARSRQVPVIPASQEDLRSKPALGKQISRPYPKKPSQIKAGGVAHSVGPEFKPQCHKKKKKTRSWNLQKRPKASATSLRPLPRVPSSTPT
jgi:hypothetical protein